MKLANRQPNAMTNATRTATIVREISEIPDVNHVHGVAFDGELLWVATGPSLVALDPATGGVKRTLHVAADAGTTFDGKYLYQLVDARIDKIDPTSGEVVSSIPAPGDGSGSGMAWAEGSLWVGQYKNRKIHQVDPETGKIVRTLDSNRFVTGVTWEDGELWHGTWEDEQSEIRRIDAETGEVRQSLSMPPGQLVAGLAADGEVFYCGGGNTGRVRIVERPNRGAK
jgi:glutamine cyclotransferase